MKTIILLASILTSFAATAASTHKFWCAASALDATKQVYFEIDDHQVPSQVGTLTVAKFLPENARWEVVEKAQVKARIFWWQVEGKNVIRGIEVDMGKTGKLEAFATTAYKNGSSAGFVRSNLRVMNFPNGVDANYCSYFFAKQPKPIMTGSN